MLHQLADLVFLRMQHRKMESDFEARLTEYELQCRLSANAQGFPLRQSMEDPRTHHRQQQEEEQRGGAWDGRFLIHAMLQCAKTERDPDPLCIVAFLWQRCYRALEHAAQSSEQSQFREPFFFEGTSACIEQLALDCPSAVTAADMLQPV